MSTKSRGDLLENIVAELCGKMDNTKVTQKAKVYGKRSEIEREVDILIEGKVGMFDVIVAIESKNYGEPVGIDKIESFKTKLDDIGANLGVMVCPTGFTEPACRAAKSHDIQLFTAYDERLGNSSLFIPLRYIAPEIKSYSLNFSHRAGGPFSMPTDKVRWRFHIDGKILDTEKLVIYAWNHDKIPQIAGDHVANFGAVTMSDTQQPNKVQYVELSINIFVIEKYYLKLFPASFLEQAKTGNKKFSLYIHAFSKEEDMIKNGWKKFQTFEELNKAADIENQPTDVRELLIREHYQITDEKTI